MSVTSTYCDMYSFVGIDSSLSLIYMNKGDYTVRRNHTDYTLQPRRVSLLAFFFKEEWLTHHLRTCSSTTYGICKYMLIQIIILLAFLYLFCVGNIFCFIRRHQRVVNCEHASFRSKAPNDAIARSCNMKECTPLLSLNLLKFLNLFYNY